MTETIDKNRRQFLLAATTALGAVGVAFAATPFIVSWMPSVRTLAMEGPVEVDITKLEEGAQLTVEWRGQPVWVVRRTKAELAKLASLNNLLRDPNSNEPQQPSYAKNLYRSIKPEYLVLIGLCTHLGCVPSYMPDIGSVYPGWPGGFFCPCHGSKFDMAGRVFKGVPAPLNLVVPPYIFENDHLIRIG
jgi:ubiquinol-cytochrome c reductase iron-sulfur subunit